MQLKKLMLTVSEWLSQGEDVMLVTIIADSGSVPRGAGARMAMISNGNFTGTIGGGAVEYKAQQMALEALKHKNSLTKSFILSHNDKEDIGMICGGNVTVSFQYISALDKKALHMFTYGAELFSQNVDSWLVTDISEGTERSMSIYAPDSKNGSCIPGVLRESGLFTNRSVQIEVSGRMYFSEPLTRAGKTYIFGGGHISQELVPLLSHLGFSCVVFDSLPKFASRELFPTSDGVIVGDFNDIFASVSITEKDYVVIMTRGHSSDYTVEEQVMRRNPRYIGVIGSRKKCVSVSQKLLAQGFSQKDIDRVHSPIGIAIKAETPAEIAVSIAAELIMIRAAGD